MEARATAKWIRTGPRKVRKYADLVRYQPLEQARALLSVQPAPAAKALLKCLDSAVANAENNHGMDAEELRIEKLCVDEALRIPRLRHRARGRADRFHHQLCHISVVLTDEPAAGAAPARPSTPPKQRGVRR